MNTSINLQILDRFRHVERMMRVAAVPCADALKDKGAKSEKKDEEQNRNDAKESSAVGVLKRDSVLPFLLCKKEGIKQKEIADEIKVSPSTLSEMINRLVEDGYIERRAEAGDRRVKTHFLTERGVERAEFMMAQINLVVDNLFVNLDDTEKLELIRLLDKLVGNTPDKKDKGEGI